MPGSGLIYSQINWFILVPGSGGNVASSNSVNTRPGIISITSSNTSANNYCGVYSGKGSGGGLVINDNSLILDFQIKLHYLYATKPPSPNDQQFIFQCGIGRDFVKDDQTYGVYFEYDGSISANWRYCTANNFPPVGNHTKLSSAVAVTTNWVSLSMLVTSNTSVEYFVNGSSIGTIATNLPSNVACNPYVKVYNTVKNDVNIGVDVDLIVITQILGTSRK